MNTQRLAVLVMAKTPRPGRVKTRLQPLLGTHGCVRLQAALIARTVHTAASVAPDGCYLALDAPADRVLLPRGVSVLRQRGAHLGARMADAVEQVFREHRGPLAVIGTDVPTLTAEHLIAAADRLADGVDVVFGPALDGGYYLIAMRRSRPELFAIDPGLWGGPAVLDASLAAAAEAGLRVDQLDVLRDLDTPADAAALLREPALPARVAELLRAAS